MVEFPIDIRVVHRIPWPWLHRMYGGLRKKAANKYRWFWIERQIKKARRIAKIPLVIEASDVLSGLFQKDAQFVTRMMYRIYIPKMRRRGKPGVFRRAEM